VIVQNKNFGNINSGDFSSYQKFSSAYRYDYINVEIDGMDFTIQPIDFVGESMLEDGIYTYELDITELSEQYGSLKLKFRED